MTKTDTCRSCSQPIVFAVSAATGRRAPLDPKPDAAGNVRMTVHPSGARTFEVVPPARREPGEQLHHSHFETCPNAKRHRSAGKRGAAR